MKSNVANCSDKRTEFEAASGFFRGEQKKKQL